MESSDGIGDDVLTPNPEFPDQEFTPSQHEGDEVTSGDIIGTPSRTTVTYPKPEKPEEPEPPPKPPKPKPPKPKPKQAKTPQQRADELADTIRNFRIAHAGDGLLRGSFGWLPDSFQDLKDQIANMQRSTDQFNLEGDDLNVSGSFDKGYTVDRQDPCPPPQESTDE